MSVSAAFGVALAGLLLPWFFLPRFAGDELRGSVRVLWWLNAMYCRIWHGLEVRGPVTVPEQGAALLVCNHTCCIDHMILQSATPRLLGFMIAKELYEYWLFRPFCALSGCIPVRRDGRDLSATRAALRALGEGRVVPIFPEGKITPTSGRDLGEGKPGVAFIAAKAGVPVIPAYICGTPPTRKVVASYLTPSRARVYFGPPVDLSDLTAGAAGGRPDFDRITERLMGAIRRLRVMEFGAEISRTGVPTEGTEGASSDDRLDGPGFQPIPVAGAPVHAS